MTIRRMILSEWMYVLGIILGAIGIIAGGVAYRMEQIDDQIEDERVQKLIAMVEENRQILQSLERAKEIGPRHTACDTSIILKDIRKGKIADHYSVEDRCKQ